MPSSANARLLENNVAPCFPARWSPRAFADEAMAMPELIRMFEAARWAPSAFNSQPWRFVYSLAGDNHWGDFVGCLFEKNQAWAANASVLVLLCAKKTLILPGQQEEIPSPSASFDSGAAWASLALQASMSGWAAHAMGGLDKERARRVAGVPDGFSIEVMIAVGRPGEKSTLPEPLQAMEAPNGRQPLSQIAWAGRFGGLMR